MLQEEISALSLPAKGITTLYGLKELAKYQMKAMDLRGNKLGNFEHFGTHPELQELHLENNTIDSFLGLTKQKSMTHLNLRGNPVAEHAQYRVMALLTVGFTLHTIDGRRVEPQERELARYMGPTAALAVSYGWLPDGMPHTNPEYEAIITKLRAQRKAKLHLAKAAATSGSDGDFVTILSVLDRQEQEKEHKKRTQQQHEQLVNEFGDAVSATSSVQAKETIDLQRQAMTHLTEKIAKLEMELAQARKQIEMDKANRLAAPSVALVQPGPGQQPGQPGQAGPQGSDCVIGLSTPDVAALDSVTFNPPSGLFVESNKRLCASATGLRDAGNANSAMGSGSGRGGGKLDPQRCVLTVTSSSITVLSFFARSVMATIDLSAVHDTLGDAPRRAMVLRCKDGALFQFTCKDEIPLCALYKTLFLIQGKTPGPLNGLTQEVLDQTKVHFRPRAPPIQTDRPATKDSDAQTTGTVQIGSTSGSAKPTPSPAAAVTAPAKQEAPKPAATSKPAITPATSTQPPASSMLQPATAQPARTDSTVKPPSQQPSKKVEPEPTQTVAPAANNNTTGPQQPATPTAPPQQQPSTPVKPQADTKPAAGPEQPQPADSMQSPGKPASSPGPMRKQPSQTGPAAPVAVNAKTPPEAHVMAPAQPSAAALDTKTSPPPAATSGPQVTAPATTPTPAPAAKSSPPPAVTTAPPAAKDDDTSEGSSQILGVPKRRRFEFEIVDSDSDSDDA